MAKVKLPILGGDGIFYSFMQLHQIDRHPDWIGKTRPLNGVSFSGIINCLPCRRSDGGRAWPDRQSKTETCDRRRYLAGHLPAVEGGRRREVGAVPGRGVHVDGVERPVGACEELLPERRERQRTAREEHERHLGHPPVRVPPDPRLPRRRPQELLVGHVVPRARRRSRPPLQRRVRAVARARLGMGPLPRRRRGRQGVRDGEPREHGVGGAAEEQDDDGEEARGEHRQEEERAEELQRQRRSARRRRRRPGGSGVDGAILAIGVRSRSSSLHADQLKTGTTKERFFSDENSVVESKGENFDRSFVITEQGLLN
jgi:hypothetical protein